MRATILQQRKKRLKVKGKEERYQRMQKKTERDTMRKEEMERKRKSRVGQFGGLKRLTYYQ